MRVKLSTWCDRCDEELTFYTTSGTVECRCGKETVSDIMDIEKEYSSIWNSGLLLILRETLTDLNKGENNMVDQCMHGFLFKCGDPAIYIIHYKNTDDPAFYCKEHVLNHIPNTDVLIRVLHPKQAANCEER